MKKLYTFVISAVAALSMAAQLPFTESFNSVDQSNTTGPFNTWTIGSTATSATATWRYASRTYFGNVSILPIDEVGGLAYVGFYSNPSQQYDATLTSAPIAINGAEGLELSFFYFAINGGYDPSLDAQIAFDGGKFETLHHAEMAEVEYEGWRKVAERIAVPAGASTATIRFSAHNGYDPETVAIDEITLRSVDAPTYIYPSSVSDFNAEYSPENADITVSFTAPTLSHPSLGDENSQPLESISRIELYRQIGDYTGYDLLHTFVNPTPGEALEYIDTDLDKGGYYYYKAIVFVGSCSDYGEYLDAPILVGQIPADVTDLALSSARGKLPVTVAFTAPSTDLSGLPYRGAMNIRLDRYNLDTFAWDTINQWSAVEPGTAITFDDTTAEEDATIQYRVICSGAAGNSYGSLASIYLGIDQPAAPTNVVATLGDDNSVIITWDAPSEGINLGWIDSDNLTYIIYCGTGYSDYDAEVIATGVTGTSYTDVLAPDMEEALFKYFVKAVSAEIAGYSEMSNAIVVGNPSTLPYTENFNQPLGYSVIPEHVWTTASSENSSDWSFAELAYFITEGQAVPVDRDGGLAYCYYGIYSDTERDDYLTSGRIDLAGAELPVASFWYYALPLYDTEISLLTKRGSEAADRLWHTDFANNQSLVGWQHVFVPMPLEDGADDIIKLMFHAHKGTYACSAAIDNVAVFDLPAPQLTAAGTILSWTAPHSEFADLTGFTVYRDAEAIAQLPATETSYNCEPGEGRYTVRATYEDGALATLPSNAVTIETEGITDASIAADATYFTPAGIPVASPAAPGIYIRRQGSATTKLIVK